MIQMLKAPTIRATVAKIPPIIGPIFEDFRGMVPGDCVSVGAGATDVEVSESFRRLIAPSKALIALD
jgi:hypothetical protein